MMAKYLVSTTFRGIEEGVVFKTGELVELDTKRADAINKKIKGALVAPADKAAAEAKAKEEAEATKKAEDDKTAAEAKTKEGK
jgi:preprotein translocase subunit SecF